MDVINTISPGCRVPHSHVPAVPVRDSAYESRTRRTFDEAEVPHGQRGAASARRGAVVLPAYVHILRAGTRTGVTCDDLEHPPSRSGAVRRREAESSRSSRRNPSRRRKRVKARQTSFAILSSHSWMAFRSRTIAGLPAASLWTIPTNGLRPTLWRVAVTVRRWRR